MFNIIDSAIASQSTRSSKYGSALSGLAIATKDENGQFNGPAVQCEKIGEVLSFRAAAKVAGFGIVTRKQADGKVNVWKVALSDVPARKPRTVSDKPKTPKAKKAQKA